MTSGRERDRVLFEKIDGVLSGHELQHTTPEHYVPPADHRYIPSYVREDRARQVTGRTVYAPNGRVYVEGSPPRVFVNGEDIGYVREFDYIPGIREPFNHEHNAVDAPPWPDVSQAMAAWWDRNVRPGTPERPTFVRAFQALPPEAQAAAARQVLEPLIPAIRRVTVTFQQLSVNPAFLRLFDDLAAIAFGIPNPRPWKHHGRKYPPRRHR